MVRPHLEVADVLRAHAADHIKAAVGRVTPAKLRVQDRHAPSRSSGGSVRSAAPTPALSRFADHVALALP